MKTASTIIHIFALAACLSVNAGFAGEEPMAGFRRAVETISETSKQTRAASAARTTTRTAF